MVVLCDTTAREGVKMREATELKKLALDIYKGQVFGTWQIRNPKDVGMVFMCAALMDKKMANKLEVENIVHFCEYLHKAGPRSINGMPTFFSMQIISKSEWDLLVPMIKELQKLEEVFVAGDQQ